MDSRLIFPERGVVTLQPHHAHDPKPDEVRVTTTLSLMSTGTENTVFTGAFSPTSVFAEYGALPFSPGYVTVGVVDSVGAEVTDVQVGTRVFHREGHGSRFTLPRSRVTRIPEEVSDEEAVWTGIAKIALRAAIAAPFALAQDVVIVGGGPIGQMTVRWAATAGCREITVVCPSNIRLEHARAGGATALIRARLGHDRLEDVLGTRPSLVVDTTGSADVFAHLLGLAGDHATVLLLGETGYPEKQHLTSDVMTKGLTITAVHDDHERHGGTSPALHHRILDLMAQKKFNCAGLISHRFPAGQAAEAYRLANEQRAETMGIAFMW
ncbi:zinc-binding alcohol dehydrogenase [Streptomyces sp. NPDC001137]|uniref:zinc-dependent alcohol dehydrogenase n=1 Tax=Streptomyces sp. NPDC001137 TaxID=3154378 RepID=UPI003325A4C0